MPKSKRGKERPRYCRCTVTCTSKIKRTTRLRHYRKANIPFDEAPPSITATESSAEDGPESTIHIECNQSRRDESMHDGILESNSKRGLDDGDSEELGYFGGNQLENQQESEYEALRMDVDEDSADTASGLEEEDFNNNEASEFDAWKEFDEQAEEDFLSDSDRLSELDKMLEDDLAADADEAEGWANRKEFLTEADHDNIRAFKVRMVANMPRVAFNQMRYAFKHKLDINSHYSIIRRLAVLSGIEPSYFDCCPNSCIAYTGEYADLDQCPLCSQVRFREGTNRVPRRQFGYIPLIHRLQNFFANPKAVEELSYRDKYQAKAGVISDVFDGEHYQSLILRAVTVDGKKLEHKYFSGRHDIAFSVCLDGYLLYKRRRGGPSATPIIVQIYNLPPEIRTLISRTLCLGVIPGPKGPKRIDTFLHAFETECVELAIGVNTFNCVTQSHFPLHAYNLFPHGDILAIEKFLNVKGHNGKCPCRSCKIKAINNPDSRDKTYYTPLSHPRKQPKRKCFSLDPLDLPLRAHEDWTDATAQLASAVKVMDRKALAKELGIKGMPALTRVGSINYARGIPWDFMHLLFENVIKNLVYLWMGKFKGLDEGNENYTIPPAIWEEIGKETVEAVKHIPSAFVRSLGNLAEDSSYFTAEGWAFWYMFLAPILLQGRFQKTVYYTHLCELADIMKTCIKFSLRHEEIDELEVRIADWVKDYERIYYQYNINRLSTCTLTIHGLLHVCDNIRFCGPVWTTWTFWMERYCGYLQAGLRSRSHPWANLTNRVLHKAYLDQIDIYYDLEDDVTITSKGLRRGEKVFNGYPHSILRPPYKKSFTLDAELQSKISRYFSAVINNRKSAAIRKKLPKTMSSWGKVRIAGGGDCIRAVSGKNSNRGRNMSYVRYEVEVIDADNNNIREIFYGRLDLILEFDIPHSDFWTPDFCGTTVLLAVITPCVTSGKDATKEVTTYTQTTTQIVTDLRTISAVIGRIWTQNRWGIVDRSEDTSRTEFIPSNMEVFDLPGSDDSD